MLRVGCRNIEAWTRTDLNEMTAHPLTLHVLADCWVRAFTSLAKPALQLDPLA